MTCKLDIWQASILDAMPHFETLVASLSEEEKARGERFVNPEHSRRFLLAQAILRDVLSRYLEQSPDSLIFKRTEHGKPFLENHRLKFNLSHSCDRVLVGLSTESEVGVDIEYTQNLHRFDELIERFFSPSEYEAFLSYSSEEEQRFAFYRGWTRKEAYLKAIGLGLSFPLNEFVVSLAPNEMHALLSVKDDRSVRSKWTVFSFDVDDDYLASVATEAVIDNWQTSKWSFDAAC